jgi:hypothetical protein
MDMRRGPRAFFSHAPTILSMLLGMVVGKIRL